jgi:hypothetical protein
MRSSEPEQLARHCNRVVALRDGRVTQEFVGADLNTDKISLATLSRAVSVRDLTLARTDAEASTPFCLPECPRISRERDSISKNGLLQMTKFAYLSLTVLRI